MSATWIAFHRHLTKEIWTIIMINWFLKGEFLQNISTDKILRKRSDTVIFRHIKFLSKLKLFLVAYIAFNIIISFIFNKNKFCKRLVE